MNAFDVNFGYVHFDNPSQHDTGYYSVNGEEAKRLGLGNTGELATNTVWLTNLGFNVMRHSNLTNNVRYRRDEYLGEKVRSLLLRLGYIDLSDSQKAREATQIISGVFFRTMQYANKYTGMSLVHNNTLRNGLRELIYPEVDPILDVDMFSRFSETECYFSATERKYAIQDDVNWFALYVSPYKLCKYIASQYYPVFNTSWVNVKAKHAHTIIEESSEEQVGIVKATFSNFDIEINSLINFGSGGSAKRGQRRWLPLAEAKFLSKVSDMTIEDMYIAKKTYQPIQILEILERIPKSQIYTLSGMLFLYNLWASLSQKHSGNQYVKDETRKNLSTGFVRHYDRYYCLSKAMSVAKDNFEIMGYGGGKVYINLTKNIDNRLVSIQAKEILDTCRKHGLLPSKMAVKEKDDVLSDDIENKDQHLLVHQTLWGRGLIDTIISYDIDAMNV